MPLYRAPHPSQKNTTPAHTRSFINPCPPPNSSHLSEHSTSNNMASSQDHTMKQAHKFTAVAFTSDLRTRHKTLRSSCAEIKKGSRQRNAASKGPSRTNTGGDGDENQLRSSPRAEKETQQRATGAAADRERAVSDRAAGESARGADRVRAASDWAARNNTNGKQTGAKTLQSSP